MEGRSEVLQEYLRQQAAKVLGLPGAGAVDTFKPLYDLGMDSLMAVEIRNGLGAALGTTLPATVLFDYPTIEGLAAYLDREVLTPDAGSEAPPAPELSREKNAVREERVQQLIEMSDEEVERILAGKLHARSGVTPP